MNELRDWLQQEHADPNGLRPHFPIEIRFSDSDDVWLSPSYGRKTTWIGIIQYKCVCFLLLLGLSRALSSHSADKPHFLSSFRRPYGLNVPYRKLFSRFEQILARHEGRPHWAKSHPLRPDDLRQLYPHFDDFVRVLEDVDPNGMFRNEYVQRHIFDQQGEAFGERVYKRIK